MTATRAGRAGARAGSHGAGDSNTLGCRDDRRTLAHISGASSLGFLAAEFIERPRISRRGGLGVTRDNDDGAVGFDLVAGDRDGGLGGLFGDARQRRLARLARLEQRGVPLPSLFLRLLIQV